MHPAAATPWRLEVHDSLPSTSVLCVERARGGEPGGLAIQAYRQTAGQGSRGRGWSSMEGNLALSVLVRPGGEASRAGQWAIAGAVAFREGLAPFADDLRIKWPNDIQRGGRKAGGLLINAEAEGGLLPWVVLGFGANLCSAPPGAAVLGGDAAEVASSVLRSLGGVLATWSERGFGAVRDLWLGVAHPAGTPLRVQAAGLDAAGTFAGLTPEGALLLDTAEGVRTFSTGEVLLG